MSDTEKNNINDDKEINEKKDLSDTNDINISVSDANKVNDNTSQKSKEPEIEPPDEFICPITFCIIQDPVVAKDGHTYENAAIKDWFTKKRTSPMSNVKLTSTEVIPNLALKNLIQKFLKENPNCANYRATRISSQGFFAARSEALGCKPTQSDQPEQTESSSCKPRRPDQSQQEERSRCTIL